MNLPCTTFPIYVWALVLVPAIGFPLTTSAVLYRGAVAAALGRRATFTVAATAGAMLGGWLVLSGVLASAGVYRQDPADAVPGSRSRLPASLSHCSSDPGSRSCRALSMTRAPLCAWLSHTLRIAGVVFLIVMAQGHLPAAFALPAGLGDMAIGVAAPFVARRLAHGTGRSEAVRFHVFGIVDLVVAGSIGFLLLELVEVTPSTAPLLRLPLALILTVAVPLAVALHVISLRWFRAAALEDQAGPLLAAPAAG
jgi:hypothetical protein